MATAFQVMTRFTAKDEQSMALKSIANASKIASIAIAGISFASINMAANFDAGLRKTSSIMDKNIMSFSEMRKGILALSNETGRSVDLLTAAQYQYISATGDTAGSLRILKVATDAAIGGFTTEEKAIDSLTGVLNAYRMETNEASKISDQMIATQNFGKTTYDELATSIGDVLPFASALNIKTETLFASIATLTRNSINTSKSVTGLSAAFRTLSKPLEQLPKFARDAIKKTGVMFGDAAVKAHGFDSVVRDIAEKAKKNPQLIQQLFGDAEAQKVMLVLAGKGIEDLSTGIDLITNSQGAAKKAAEEQIGAQLRVIRVINRIKNIMIELGTIVLPIVEKISDKILVLANKFDNLSDGQKKAIVITTGVVLALTSLSFIIPNVVATFVALKVASLGVFSVLKKISIWAMANPLYIIIGAVVALGAGFYMLQKKVGGIIPALKVVGQTLLQVVLSPINSIIFAISSLISLMSIAAKAIGLDSIAQSLGSASDKIKDMQDKTNLAMTGTTSIMPGSRIIEAYMQGNAEDTKKENKLFSFADYTPTANTLDLNINNNSGFSADIAGKSSIPGLNLNLNNGAQ